MARFERVCPECGTSNAYDKTQCAKCRAPLTGAPASNTPPTPILSRKGAAKLAWRATKFLTVMGATLAWRGAQRGIEKIREARSNNVQNETIDGAYIVPGDAPEPEIQLPPTREWRVWSGDPDDDSTEQKTSLHWGTVPPQKSG